MQRTPPSAFIFTVLATASVFFRLVGSYSFWLCAAVILGTEESRKWFSYTDSDLPVDLKFGDGIPIQFPDILIAFKTRPPPADQAKLDEWNVEAEQVSTVKKEVFIVRNPTSDQVRDIMQFSGIQDTYRSTNTTITVHGIMATLELISKISMISWMFKEICSDSIEIKLDEGVKEYNPAGEIGTESMDIEEGEEKEWILEHRASNFAARMKKPRSDCPWGSVEKLLEDSPSGIFCPFEQNFAAPDPSIIKGFLQAFSSLFSEDVGDSADTSVIEDVSRVWATELSNTMTGLFMAHMMASLLIAKDGGAYVYFIQMPEKRYEGSVIVKQARDMVICGAGIGKVLSVDNATLAKELHDFGFHSVILRKILDLIGGGAIETTSVTSLRHLREIVFSGTGMPEGTTRNKISRLLPKLSFPERPLGVNETAIDTILSLLTSNSSIPKDLFLATESFFCEEADRTRLILAAWGNRPPTFNFGGTVLMATGRKGQGVGQKVQDYVTTPPTVLQMKRVPMDDAVSGWNTMLQKGFINGIYNRKLPGSRSFNGAEKTRVWSMLAKYLAQSITSPKDLTIQASTSGPSGSKRLLDERDATGNSAKRVKRLI